jgi:GLPGLI family protein
MKYLFVVFLLVGTQGVFGQTMEGSIRYLVTHDWSKKMAAVDYISKQQRERIAYMWGNRSEWKLYTTLFFSPTHTKYEDSEEKAEPEDEGYSWRKEVYMVNHDLEKNTELDLIEMLGKTYVVEDSLQGPDWKIQNDLKEVAGHVCMNAFWADTLKAQKVKVWFALDMPISAGPERFYGLPGMILEVDVNDGGMLITADKIDLRPVEKELALPKKIKGKKVNEAQYRAVLKEHMENKRKEEEPPFWGIRY